MSQETELIDPDLGNDVVEWKIKADIARFSQDVGCYSCDDQANKAIDLYMGDVEVTPEEREGVKKIFRSKV